MCNKLIITNNRSVKDLYQSTVLSRDYELRWVDGDTLEVLTQVRDMCHTGARLLTHPLTGSIKPNQTPFKTVVILKTGNLDSHSVLLAEDSWNIASSLNTYKPTYKIGEQIQQDLRLIDLDLFKSYLQSQGHLS